MSGARAGNVAGMLAWMDLEMTGLDPARNVIVEIATIITDDELNIVAEGPDLVVHADVDALAIMDEVVVAMHTRSGLLDAIRASTVTLDEAMTATLDFLRAQLPEANTVPLCGNSIVNAPGLIDRGYRGEVIVALLNTDPDESIAVRRGDRIAQLVILAVPSVVVCEVDELSESPGGPGARGTGGYGNSGR